MAVPRWKQEMLDRKQREEDERRKREEEEEKIKWFDQLVGPAAPTWVQQKKAQREQELQAIAALKAEEERKVRELPAWKRELLEKNPNASSEAKERPPMKPPVRLY